MPKLTVMTVRTHPHPSVYSFFDSFHKVRANFCRLRLILVFLIIKIHYFLQFSLVPVSDHIFTTEQNISLISEKINFLTLFLFQFFRTIVNYNLIVQIVWLFTSLSFVTKTDFKKLTDLFFSITHYYISQNISKQLFFLCFQFFSLFFLKHFVSHLLKSSLLRSDLLNHTLNFLGLIFVLHSKSKVFHFLFDLLFISHFRKFFWHYIFWVK